MTSAKKQSVHRLQCLTVLTFLLALSCAESFGQCLGNTLMCVGETSPYEFAGSSSRITWIVSGGDGYVINGSIRSKKITITWTAAGTYSVTAQDDGGLGQDCSMLVTVRAATPGTTTLLTGSPICQGGSATLQLSGNQGNIIRWESSTDGNSWTSINTTAAQFTVSNIQRDTWYHAVINSCSQQAISTATLVDITEVDAPSVAAVTAVCPGNVVTLKITNSKPAPSQNLWYAEDNVSLIAKSYGDSFETPELIGNTVYYVGFQLENGCQGPRTKVPVSVYSSVSVPAKPYMEVTSEPVYSVKVFSNNANNSAATYYWQRSVDTKDLSNSSTVLENPASGLYYIRALSSQGCWSLSSSAVDVINHTPTPYNYVRSAANYVRTYTPSAPTTKVQYPSALDNEADPYKVQTVTGYMDGFGRPIQQVARQNSPGRAADVVTPTEYDEAGRAQREYLPYVDGGVDGQLKMNPIVDQRDFYGAANQTSHSYFPFKYVQLERAPDDKPKAMYAPGESWAGNAGTSNEQADHAVKVYDATNQADEVLFFTIGGNGKIVLPTGLQKYYSPNQLYARITRDEQKNISIEYTDKSGQMICRKIQYDTGSAGQPMFAETYYVYNDYGDLIVVLPPEAVKAFNEQ